MSDMSEHFIEWYKEVNPNASREVLEMRNKGLQRWMDIMEEDYEFKYINLIPHIIFGQVDVVQDEYDIFVQCFKDNDDLFQIKNNDGELLILAGEVYCRMLDWDDHDSVDASMAIISQAFGKKFTMVPQKDVYDLAQKYIESTANKNRSESEEFKKTDFKKKQADLKEVLTKVKENPNLPASEFLGKIVDSVLLVIEDAENSKNYIESLSQRNDFLSEELNLLWWLQNGRNTDSDELYSDLTKFQSALLIGREFSKLVIENPGPVSLKPLMKKQILNCKEGSALGGIKKYIESLKNEYSKEIASSTVSSKEFVQLLPIHEGIKRHVQSGGDGEGWFKTFCTDFKITDSEDIQAVDIAYQFYLENKIITRLENI